MRENFKYSDALKKKKGHPHKGLSIVWKKTKIRSAPTHEHSSNTSNQY